MVSSITGHLQRHAVNPSLKFSEDWAHENWDNWNKIEEQLNLTRGNVKDGKEKGVICKMLGTCFEAACHYEEYKEREMQMLQDEVEQRKRWEMLLSLQRDRLLTQLGEA